MYQECSQMNDKAIQKIMDDNKRLTSMFIHELRNPLSLIKGTLQYIEIKHQEVKEYKYWNQLSELIHDMEHLMTDASLLNSINALIINNTDLLALIQLMVDSYSPQADNQQKLLTFKHTTECESLCSSYPCDSEKIKQVLSNLFRNALEATEPGNIIEVFLSTISTDSGPMLSIQINNNGKPIPEDELDTVFLPFVTHKTGGTGIGLALTKQIIEAHLGSIKVSSSDELTVFTILLPLQRAL